MDLPFRTSATTSPALEELGRDLVERGIELFASTDRELQIAERVRVHLMDSGVRVRLEGGWLVLRFTATASKAAHPTASEETLFQLVRDAIGGAALARGYREHGAVVSEARDPQDASRVFDVFYGVEYALSLEPSDRSRLEDEVRWVLSRERSLAG